MNAGERFKVLSDMSARSVGVGSAREVRTGGSKKEGRERSDAGRCASLSYANSGLNKSATE